MANSDSVADDWLFFAKKFHFDTSNGTGHFSMLVASPSLRLCHDLHLVGGCSNATVDDGFFDMVLTVDILNPFSLRQVRGSSGIVDAIPNVINVESSRGGGDLFALSASQFSSRGNFGFRGIWLLNQVVNFASAMKLINADVLEL